MPKQDNYLEQRWRWLMHDVRLNYSSATEEEVRNLLSSKWLDRIVKPKTAVIARTAFFENLSYVEIGLRHEISSSRISTCVRSVATAVCQLYNDVARGFATVHDCMEVSLTMDSPLYSAVACGLCDMRVMSNVQDAHTMTFAQLRERCNVRHGIPHPLRPSCTCYECQQVCDVCRKVHELNGQKCEMRLSLQGAT